MTDNRETVLSPAGRVGLALLLIVGGGIVAMASVDLGPLSSAEINGPPWLAAAAGGVILLAGLSVAAGPQRRQHPFSYGIAFLVLAGLAAIGNWIALGPGLRGCRVEIPGLTSSDGTWISGIGCRAAFGIGALAMDGILVWMLAMGIGKALGPGNPAHFVQKFGEGALLIGLAPILVPMVLFLIVKSLAAVLRDRFRTGKWPRNEGFIERLKKRRRPD
ncbi:MAG: hypothetical protein JJE39_08725 [Vicinamibacteria bacterium]|nr:hypothetical protein [Vicinamibacteria bacterium]